MIKSRRTAKEIMTTPVHTVQPTDSLEKVIEVICRQGVSGVPVVQDDKRLVGIISEHDIIHSIYSCDFPDSNGATNRPKKGGLRDISMLTAKDIMVEEVITAQPDTEFLRLASIMALRRVRRIPIVEGERLVGIVSHGDIGRAIFGNTGKSTICPAMRTDSDTPSGSGS